MDAAEILRASGRFTARLALLIALGAAGAICCAFLVFSLRDLLGWSGDTGARPGEWHPTFELWFAIVYAMPIGIIATVIAGTTVLRRTPLLRSIPTVLLGTLVGALVGSPMDIFLLLLTTLGGFAAGCALAIQSAAPRLHDGVIPRSLP